MARQKALSIVEPRTLEPITAGQQTFIEHLLAGRNISQAALLAGISRRTATYWLADPAHPVTLEYEKQRVQQQQEFEQGIAARIANLHELAFKAMEDALSPDAPPAIRFQAAKFLYEKHLEQLCRVQAPRSPQDLVEKQAKLVGEREHFQQWNEHRLRDVPD